MTTGARKPGVFVKTAHHENNNDNKNNDNNNKNNNLVTIMIITTMDCHLIMDIIGKMDAQNWITFIHCGLIYV